jgi:general secretion pathway protein I
MRNHSLPLSNGFTLLEVLVALVILGLTLAYLSATVSDSLIRAERIDDDDRAIVLADATLARLGNDIPLRLGITQGVADGLNWRLVVAPEPSGPTSVPLDIVDFTVSTRSNRIIGRWRTLRVAAQTTH